MNESEIKKISCYAALQAGYVGDNYLSSHMRLVLLLIYRKKYTVVKPEIIINDFKQEFQYEISYFPMLKILSLAVKNGFLTRDHNSKKYTATKEIAQVEELEKELKKNEDSFLVLVNRFVQFCKEQGVEYSQERAIQIIYSYVTTQKLYHISGHIQSAIKDARIDFLFGKFVFQLSESNTSEYEMLNRFVIGAVLVDCLVFHEDLGDNNQVNNITFIFDTTPVLISLGIDMAGRQDYYCELLASLKEKGAKLAMFRHSYDEMQQILAGAEEWVDNDCYDSSKASATTEYFRSKNASKGDVEQFSLELKDKVEALGIEILDEGYVRGKDEKINDKLIIDENLLYEMIANQYKESNPLFDEQSQRKTIELDVKSIALTYIYRNGQKPVHIHEASCLFVTANQTIMKMASEYHLSHNEGNKTLPTTITEVYLGTYLWLSDPMRIEKMNRIQIVSHAYMAFQPNEQLLNKLSVTVEKLLTDGKIDTKTCYALRSNRFVSEKLAQKTYGDPDAFTEKTPLEIIQEIREEGWKQGKEESERQFNSILEGINKKSEEIHLRDEREKKELMGQNSELSEENIKIKLENEALQCKIKEIEKKEKERKENQKEMELDAYEKRIRTITKTILISFLIIFIILIVITIVLITKGNKIGSLIMGVITVLPILGGMVMCIIKVIRQKDVSAFALYETFIRKKRQRKQKSIEEQE